MTTITVSDETRVSLVRLKDERLTSLDKVIDDILHKAEQFELNESIPVTASDPKTVVLSDDNYTTIMRDSPQRYMVDEWDGDTLCNAAISFYIRTHSVHQKQLAECENRLQQISDLSIDYRKSDECVEVDEHSKVLYFKDSKEESNCEKKAV